MPDLQDLVTHQGDPARIKVLFHEREYLLANSIILITKNDWESNASPYAMIVKGRIISKRESIGTVHDLTIGWSGGL